MTLDWWLQNRLRASPPPWRAWGIVRALRRRFEGRYGRARAPDQEAQRLRTWLLERGGLDRACEAALDQLLGRYPATWWASGLGAGDALHSLWLLEQLERLPVAPPRAGERGLEIGCGRWGTLPALCAWGGEDATAGGRWDGVELDAHRRYADGVTRRAHGQWLARRHPGCRYLCGSLLDVAPPLEGGYRAILWLLPLVTRERHAAHRLPLSFYRPLELVERAYERLLPGGWIWLVNQEEHEAVAQGRLLRMAELPAEYQGALTSPFPIFQRPRYGWLVRRPAAAG